VGGGGELMAVSKGGKKTLRKDMYKYDLSNIVVKVNGQSMYLVLQKKQRNFV
jgi:hypothetical protein